MAYDQYTQCVDVKDKKYPGNPKWPVIISMVLILAGGGGINPYTAIPMLTIIIAYCAWWLYDRLICLGGERCAIGFLGKVEPPDTKTGFDKLDTDYSINLLLAPHQYQDQGAFPTAPDPPPPFGQDPAEWHEEKMKERLHHRIADDGMQGVLIKETDTTGNEHNWLGAKTYPFEGYFSSIGGWSVLYNIQPYLHCEFEGGGIHTLMQAAIAALAFATAAAVACSIPIIGWVACAILGAIASLITLIGLIAALNDKASPSVTDPTTGQTSSSLAVGSDILFVRGEWVFDTAHEGWNEIHPIRACQRVGKAAWVTADVIDWDAAIASYMVSIGRWSWDTPDPMTRKPVKLDGPPKPRDWTDWVQAWCDGTGRAESSITIGNQQDPANQWTVHPAVDGCQPPDDGPFVPDLH